MSGGITNIAASEATKNPNSQNTTPNTGADSSAVANRGQVALAAGSSSGTRSAGAAVRRLRNSCTATTTQNTMPAIPTMIGNSLASNGSGMANMTTRPNRTSSTAMRANSSRQ